MDRLSLAPSSVSGGSRASSQTSSPITSSPASPITTTSASTPIISSSPSPAGSGSGGVVKPSSLMSRRGRPLPKFGLRKICAGCTQKIISVHEEKPGPRATRWHKKCLSCSRCSKVLDSAAVVHESATTGGLDPWCTICLVSKKKNNHNSYCPIISHLIIIVKKRTEFSERNDDDDDETKKKH